MGTKTYMSSGSCIDKTEALLSINNLKMYPWGSYWRGYSTNCHFFGTNRISWACGLLGRPYMLGSSVHPRDTWASNGWSGHESPQGKCRTSPGHTKRGSCWEINKSPAVFPQQKYLREMSVASFFCVKLWAEIRWWFKNLKSVYWDQLYWNDWTGKVQNKFLKAARSMLTLSGTMWHVVSDEQFGRFWMILSIKSYFISLSSFSGTLHLRG